MSVLREAPLGGEWRFAAAVAHRSTHKPQTTNLSIYLSIYIYVCMYLSIYHEAPFAAAVVHRSPPNPKP